MMPNFFDIFKQKTNYKKTIPIIFAIDASGSMDGNRIYCLNRAIRTVIKNISITTVIPKASSI